MKRHAEPERRASRVGSTLAAKLLAMFAILALAAACTGADDPEPEAGQTEGPGGESPADGEPVELTVWFSQESGVPADQFESFHERYPHITVTWDIVPLDDTFQTLQRMSSAGQDLPDVVRIDNFLRAGLYEAGYLRPIDDLVAQWEEEEPETYELLPEVVWESGMWDGQLVSMTFDASLEQLWYRWDWLEDAGLEVPWEPASHDEMLDALRLMKDEHPESVPLAMLGARGNGVNFLISHMLAAGVEFDGATPQLNSEAGLYLIDWYQTVVREGLTSPDVLAWGEDEYRGAFIGGRAAMMFDSIGVAEDLADVDAMNYEEQWALAPLPLAREEGGSEEGAPAAAAKGMTITTDSEHPYEASLVLRYLQQPEIATSLLVNNIVRNQAVLESEELREIYPAFEPHIDEFVVAPDFPTGTNFFEVADVLEQFLQDMLANPEAPPEELAEKWQAELEAVAPE